MDVVWLLLIVAVCLVAAFAASRIEPHWASRDGRRFMCSAQELANGLPVGRNRETQINVLPDGTLHVTRKKAVVRQRTVWRLIGKSPTPPRRVQLYLAQQVVDGQPTSHQLAIRLPNRSRCVAVLDDVLAEQGLSPAPPRGTAPPPERPDRG